MDMGGLVELLVLMVLAVIGVSVGLNFVFAIAGVKSVGDIKGNSVAVLFGFLAGFGVFPCLGWMVQCVGLELTVVMFVLAPAVAFYVARRHAARSIQENE